MKTKILYGLPGGQIVAGYCFQNKKREWSVRLIFNFKISGKNIRSLSIPLNMTFGSQAERSRSLNRYFIFYMLIVTIKQRPCCFEGLLSIAFVVVFFVFSLRFFTTSLLSAIISFKVMANGLYFNSSTISMARI